MELVVLLIVIMQFFDTAADSTEQSGNEEVYKAREHSGGL